MPIEILMPALSPTMEEGKIISWLKKEGEQVSTSDTIVEIETDKAVMELDSPAKGILGKILISNGIAKVGTLIGLILKPNEDPSYLENYSLHKINKNIEKSITSNPVENNNINELTIQEEKNTSENRIKISPLAKNIANQNNINITNISGSGPNGRIVKEDVLAFLNSDKSSFLDKLITRNNQIYQEILPSQMRLAIANKLTKSKQEVPHFYLSTEVNMDELIKTKNQINFFLLEKKQNQKISINDIIVKATSLCLKKFPSFNAAYINEKIHQYNNVDISIAVSLENGLITPILQNADQKTLFQISEQIKVLAEKAKNGKLMPNEYFGGGFTISNLGAKKNVLEFKAIINHPQASILAVASTIKKPIILENEIKIADICNFTLSSDHRIIDGSIAAEFMDYLKYLLENPVSLLM